MAEIMGLKEKQLALNEITQKLKTLSTVNDFLNSENPSGVYKISFEKRKLTFQCDDAEGVKALIFGYQKKLVAEIRSLAEQSSICFDETEENILNCRF